MFFITLGNLISLFICIFIGVICRKKHITDDSVISGLSKILTSVTVPALIIVSMQKPFEVELIKDSLFIIVSMTLINLAGALIGLASAKLFKVDSKDAGVWVSGCTFSNIVYMGFPVISSLYGSESLFLATFCAVVFNFLVYTLGIKLIKIGSGSENDGKAHNFLLNPPVISILVGFSFFLLSVKVPTPVFNALTSIGNMTTPISMIIIGSILAKGDLKTVLRGKKLYVLCFIRLILVPVITFFTVSIFTSNSTIIGILVLASGMPAAALTVILAERHNANYAFASKFVFVSTLLSILTIPLISILLQ